MEQQALTFDELATQLWEAANLLRGPVDAADFKTYIFPLLFFKRLSDVWDEEYRERFDASEGDDEYARAPENHRFQIPDGCHWNDVRRVTTDVGHALQKAFLEISAANTAVLAGIFGDVMWTNKERLPDSLLTQLLEHFSALRLDVRTAPTDALGDSYEFLIKQFADKANKKAGEFYTPRPVVRLIVRLLAPRGGETVYDPACGTGGMLLAAAEHICKTEGSDRLVLGKLYGQEKNLTTSTIARMNLILHGFEDFQVARGDTLREPRFLNGDSLTQFECVIANPPFSLEDWGDKEWENDPFKRNVVGTPPQKSGDYAWVQHMLASMNPRAGRMAIVLPHGALFRMAKEGKIRRALLERDQLDAVIGLGPNLFYGTGLAACVLLFRAHKPESHKRKVLFVDASRLFKKGRNQNELLQDHADRIFDLVTAYADAPGEAKVVDLDTILKEQQGNLNISLYVEPELAHTVPTVAESLERLKVAVAAAHAADDRLAELLKANGLLAEEK